MRDLGVTHSSTNMSDETNLFAEVTTETDEFAKVSGKADLFAIASATADQRQPTQSQQGQGSRFGHGGMLENLEFKYR